MNISLTVQARDKSISRTTLTKEDKILGVVYGPKQEATSLTIDRREFVKTFKETGESTIIELTGLATPIEALVKEVSFHPSTGAIQHVDFYAFERGKDMTTEVPLELTGQAPIEKTGGMVNKVMHEVTVTCRPSKLPAEIIVDISSLAEPDQQILISDLPALEGVTYDHEAEEVVAVAQGVRAEEPETEAEAFDPTAVEVEVKGKGESQEDA